MGFQRITVHPERMGGLPCIRDTRVTVAAVLGQQANLLLANLPMLIEHLRRGSMINVGHRHLRVRALPLAPGSTA